MKHLKVDEKTSALFRISPDYKWAYSQLIKEQSQLENLQFQLEDLPAATEQATQELVKMRARLEQAKTLLPKPLDEYTYTWRGNWSDSDRVYTNKNAQKVHCLMGQIELQEQTLTDYIASKDTLPGKIAAQRKTVETLGATVTNWKEVATMLKLIKKPANKVVRKSVKGLTRQAISSPIQAKKLADMLANWGAPYVIVEDYNTGISVSVNLPTLKKLTQILGGSVLNLTASNAVISGEQVSVLEIRYIEPDGQSTGELHLKNQQVAGATVTLEIS